MQVCLRPDPFQFQGFLLLYLFFLRQPRLPGEDGPYDAYFRAYRGRLAESVDRVKDTIATCARRGVLGDTAKIVVNGP